MCVVSECELTGFRWVSCCNLLWCILNTLSKAGMTTFFSFSATENNLYLYKKWSCESIIFIIVPIILTMSM